MPNKIIITDMILNVLQDKNNKFIILIIKNIYK